MHASEVIVLSSNSMSLITSIMTRGIECLWKYFATFWADLVWIEPTSLGCPTCRSTLRFFYLPARKRAWSIDICTFVNADSKPVYKLVAEPSRDHSDYNRSKRNRQSQAARRRRARTAATTRSPRTGELPAHPNRHATTQWLWHAYCSEYRSNQSA
jgi:hypothetical protein